MRTKTLALSALLGMIGSASLVAQTNVYSLNAVGYINVTIVPGFNMISCPLIASPDNTIGTLLPNGGGGQPTSNQYNGWAVYQWSPGINNYVADSAAAKAANNAGHVNGWTGGGTITMNPGQAVWVSSSAGAPVIVTFVGTVPQNGSSTLTQTLFPGFNMVSSAIPMSGDLVANTNTLLTGFEGGGDATYFWDVNLSPANYDTPNNYTTKHGWNGNDPTTTNIAQGFWYYNNGAGNETWTENFAINP